MSHSFTTDQLRFGSPLEGRVVAAVVEDVICQFQNNIHFIFSNSFYTSVLNMFQLALTVSMAPDVHLHVAHAQRESRVTR